MRRGWEGGKVPLVRRVEGREVRAFRRGEGGGGEGGGGDFLKRDFGGGRAGGGCC